jgi:predicted RNase H-like nuclease (RuvC/YqgF family)
MATAVRSDEVQHTPANGRGKESSRGQQIRDLEKEASRRQHEVNLVGERLFNLREELRALAARYESACDGLARGEAREEDAAQLREAMSKREALIAGVERQMRAKQAPVDELFRKIQGLTDAEADAAFHRKGEEINLRMVEARKLVEQRQVALAEAIQILDRATLRWNFFQQTKSAHDASAAAWRKAGNPGTVPLPTLDSL